MNDQTASLQAKREELLQAGVRMRDPTAVYVDEEVTVGAGTLLLPGTILRGRTAIGTNCQIGPQVMLTDCTVEEGCSINASQCEESVIEKNCQIGPYTHIRPHCLVGEGSKIGAFVQLKNCNLGKGTTATSAAAPSLASTTASISTAPPSAATFLWAAIPTLSLR